MKCPSQTGLVPVVSFDSCNSLHRHGVDVGKESRDKRMKQPSSSKKDYTSGKQKKLKKIEKITGKMTSTDSEEKSFGGIWDDKNGVVVFPKFECGDNVRDGFESAAYSREEYWKKRDDLDKWSRKISVCEDATMAAKEETIAVIVRYYNAARSVLDDHTSQKDWDCTTFFEEACWMADVVGLLLLFVGSLSAASSLWSCRSYVVSTGGVFLLSCCCKF